MNICIYWLLPPHSLTLWTDIMELFTLSISLFFDFNSFFLFLLLFYFIYYFNDKKRFSIFRNWIFSSYFRYSTVLAEEVISSEKVYEGSTVVTALNEDCSEINTTFWKLRNYPLIKSNFTNTYWSNFTPNIPNNISHAISISNDVTSCGSVFAITLKKLKPSPQKNLSKGCKLWVQWLEDEW
jgi:hypothetical protein